MGNTAELRAGTRRQWRQRTQGRWGRIRRWHRTSGSVRGPRQRRPSAGRRTPLERPDSSSSPPFLRVFLFLRRLPSDSEMWGFCGGERNRMAAEQRLKSDGFIQAPTYETNGELLSLWSRCKLSQLKAELGINNLSLGYGVPGPCASMRSTRASLQAGCCRGGRGCGAAGTGALCGFTDVAEKFLNPRRGKGEAVRSQSGWIWRFTNNLIQSVGPSSFDRFKCVQIFFKWVEHYPWIYYLSWSCHECALIDSTRKGVPEISSSSGLTTQIKSELFIIYRTSK